MTVPTIAEILRTSDRSLPDSDSARLDVEILLARTLDCDRAGIYARGNESLDPDNYERLVKQIERRAAGFPVAYITGQREFWSMPLEVNEHTLIPRPETECLVEHLLKVIPDNQALHIADLGTGSGAIALAIARERPLCRIIATDINAAALATAARNADILQISNIQLLQSDWFEQLGNMRFDVIISNPPYIEECDPHLEQGDVRFEPRQALAAGVDGMAMLDCIIHEARTHLEDGGCLLLEHGFEQGGPVRERLLGCGYCELENIPDLQGHHRGTLARWKP